jgi:hypothetical protein
MAEGAGLMRVVRNGEVEPTLEKAKAQALAIRRAAVAYGRTPVVEGIDDDPPQHRHRRAQPQRRMSPPGQHVLSKIG